MISVIVPLYNKEKSISQLIESVLEQTFMDWELIIVDDGSTDMSCKKVEIYLSDNRIHYVYKSNGGVSSARNRGIKEAKGEWIVFMDADDCFLPNALESLYGAVSKYGTPMAVSNFYYEVNGVRSPFLLTKRNGIILNNFRSWVFRTSFPRAGAAIFNRSLLECNLFDENLCRYEDAKHVFKIMRNIKVARTIDCTMVYQCDNNSLSRIGTQPEKDFVMYMDFHGKSLWEKIALGMFLIDGLNFYPDQKKYLLNKYKDSLVWIELAKVMSRFRDVYWKMYSFIL